jgi:hypothetical protein
MVRAEELALAEARGDFVALAAAVLAEELADASDGVRVQAHSLFLRRLFRPEIVARRGPAGVHGGG